MKFITNEEAYELFAQYSTPSHVIAHCEAVSDTAVKIAKALNSKGYNLDINLIRSAGLLHDLARVDDDHDEIAANLLRNMGYTKEADIIRKHMKYSTFSPINQIDETDVVCLADRICKEDKYVGVDERLEYIFRKNAGFPERQQIILAKKEELKKYISDLESVIGCSIDKLMENKISSQK